MTQVYVMYFHLAHTSPLLKLQYLRSHSLFTSRDEYHGYSSGVNK